jgi:hypothetical protein
MRGLTIREAREQIKLLRQALREAMAPAQTVEHEHLSTARLLNPAVAPRAGP